MHGRGGARVHHWSHLYRLAFVLDLLDLVPQPHDQGSNPSLATQAADGNLYTDGNPGEDGGGMVGGGMVGGSPSV